MQSFKSRLTIPRLVALVLTLAGQIAHANVPQQAESLDFRIDAQIDELRSQLSPLLQDSSDQYLADRLNSVALQLANIERLHLAGRLARRPLRSQAQLHTSLTYLRTELRRLHIEPGRPPTLEPRNGAVGTFSGTVTGSGAPAGIEGVFIDIFDLTGEWVGSVVTDSNGDYTTPGLSPGDYFARTNDMTGYINELYDDIPCYFICDLARVGRSITVHASSDTPDIDFDLEPGNTISGTITDAAVAPPDNRLEFVTVDFFDEDGQWVSNPSSNASGDYVTPGMPSGTYYAITFNLDQYLNEAYDDQLCVGHCAPTAGAEIVITPGLDTEGIDFELVKGGSVSGMVTADPAGTPIENVVVEIYESDGDWRGTGWTDKTGAYITGGGLPASATYRALTFAPAPFLNELYDGMPCSGGCDLTIGTPIVVSLGAETMGKNFALSSGGTFSGIVTDGAAGLVGVQIEIFDTAGNFLHTAFTDGAGRYVTLGLAAGNYHARTWNDRGLINELFDDIPCFLCDVTSGTLIAVSDGGADTPGIDFVLTDGGTLSGTVTSTATGDELTGVIVDIFDSAGTWLANPTTDVQGRYASPGLPTGDYYARTWNTAGYVNELYDDHPCPPTCDPVSNGTIIGVQVGADTGGIDFELDSGGSISGTITDAGTAQPIANMTVEIWDANGDYATGTVSQTNGHYEVTGLSPGTYFATTWNTLGYPGALYHGYSCQGCEALLGTPIVVIAEAATQGIDFELRKGGFVAGTVTETMSGRGIGDVHVEIRSVAGQLASWIATSADGSYTTTWPLPAGTYYVNTWNDQGYINEVYANKPCAACDSTTGTAINIGSGTTTSGIDFELSIGGSISGTLTLADPDDAPLTTIQIFDENGQWVWSQRPPTNSGDYAIDVGLPSGKYYARTAGGRPYVNEVWNDQPCLFDCDVVNDGQAIQVAAPNTTAGVDFELAPGVKLSGTVKDATTQTGIADSLVEIFNPAAERIARCRVGANGIFTCRQAVPSGTYYAATANYAGYLDELYSNPRKQCPGGGQFCDVTQGTPVVVDVSTPPDELHFTLTRGAWFEGSVIDRLERRGLPGTRILVYSNSGDLIAEILWEQPLSQVSAGSYTSCGLPAGSYFAVTDTSSTGGYHADQLYDGVPCALGCKVLSGTPINLVYGSAVTGVNFELEGFVFGDDFETGTTLAWTLTR
jgi:hypothetical protein